MKNLDKVLHDIETAGFPYIKVELEADFDRNDNDEYDECDYCYGESWQDCTECDGAGHTECSDCYGEGYNEVPDSDEVIECIECDGRGTSWCGDCDGEGRNECYECDGTGRDESTNVTSIDECDQHIQERISVEAREAIEFGMFYNDGSVDSEYTFTIATNKAHLLPEFIRAFESIQDMTGYMDTGGAGMHITPLRSSRYPSRERLDQKKLDNFIREVGKLLPSLFFLASSNHNTRSYEYRSPRISNHDKYSAIYTHGGTCFEYRLFETCYDNPEAIFGFLETISKTLAYYADARRKVPTLGRNFNFNMSHSIGGLFRTVKQLEVLDAQLKALKLEKSARQLKRERSVSTSISKVKRQEQMRNSKIKQDFSLLIEQGANISSVRDFMNDTMRAFDSDGLQLQV